MATEPMVGEAAEVVAVAAVVEATKEPGPQPLAGQASAGV